MARLPKRARISTNHGVDPPSPRVKLERRSPSPLTGERRLITCGTRRYAPIPNNCLSSYPEYRQNRSVWVARCAKELEELNLIPKRKLIRDDGLIIDWRSHVPVWSDTLKPDLQDLAATIMLAHRSNAQWHRSPIHTETPPESVATTSTRERPPSSPAHSPCKKRLPVPPRPSLNRRINASHPISTNSPPSGSGSSFPCPERPRSPDGTEYKIASSAHPLSCNPVSSSGDRTPAPLDLLIQHGQSALPPESPSRVRDPSIIPCTSATAEEDMSQLTLDYLHRYVQTYEADRASLASAYARNASFAYRVHQTVQDTSQGASSTFSQCFSSGTKRTRLDIVTTLLTLPCLHSNAQSPGTAQVEYDMFYLGAELGMFVVCRVVIYTKTVAHNFILQRKQVDVEDAVIEGVWPLTASAHQILVFET